MWEGVRERGERKGKRRRLERQKAKDGDEDRTEEEQGEEWSCWPSGVALGEPRFSDLIGRKSLCVHRQTERRARVLAHTQQSKKLRQEGREDRGVGTPLCERELER